MKMRDLLAVAAVSVFAACSSPYRATDTTVVVAPTGVQSSFTTQYPTASNVVWSTYDANMAIPIDWELSGWSAMDAGDYVVRFDMDNENYYAWYDDAGTWVGSAYVVRDMSTIPSAVTTAVNTNFSGYSISSVNREFYKDKMVYEVELKNADTKVKMLVDANGTIIKQKSKGL
jgi:hypothetical protein